MFGLPRKLYKVEKLAHAQNTAEREESEMRNNMEGQARLQEAKGRPDTDMAEKLKKLTVETVPKRPRKDPRCEIGTGS